MAFVSALPITHQVTTSFRPNVCSTTRTFTTPRNWTMNVAAPSAFKQALIEKVSPLNFGREVADNRKEQNEIEELIRQVEATNRSPSPGTDSNLSGEWDTIYTTSTSILGTGKPGFLQASRIVQEIDAPNLRAKNVEYFQFGPFKIVNSVDAKLTPVSAMRFNVNFIQFNILNLFTINVEKNNRFTGWLEVTYLDENMRISRGNKGNLFVLVKKDKTKEE